MHSARRSAWRLWWPFVLLCLLRGSRWILSGSLPAASTTLASAALGCGSAGALWLLVLRPSGITREPPRQLLRSALGGALLIAGPLLALLRPGGIAGASVTMSLALTPVVVAVVEAATRHSSETLAGRLWPGLAAIAGLLLVLAQPSFANPLDDAILVLTPVMTGCGALLFCAARGSAWRLPAALAGACAVLGLGAAVNLAEHTGGLTTMAGVAAAIDALEAVLVLLALSKLATTRWSAQFAIVPLLVLLEGFVLMPSGASARVIIGLLLLAFAAIALLVPPAEEPRFDLAASTAHPSRTE